MIEPAGLGNVGCTCYLNTALQCLSFCHPFLHFVLKTKKDGLIGELKLLFTELRVNHKSIMPHRFVSKVSKVLDMPIYQQNDMNEFLGLFIEALNKQVAEPSILKAKPYDKNTMYDKQRYIMDLDWIKKVEKEYSELIPMFYGQTIMQIVCGNCNDINHNYELFFNIMLPAVHANLNDCIDAYFKEEQVDHWTCSKCDCKSKMTKKSQRVWRLPRILIISLTTKNNAKIEIPTDLNLNKHVLTKNIYYKLVATALHFGTSESGHYSAIVKQNDHWFEIDDLSVKNMGQQLPEYCATNGCMFFYVRS